MTKLRRGFKVEAETIARQARIDLGLAAHAPLDVWRFADFLEIPLLRLTDCRGAEPDAVNHFAQTDSGAFSAVTVFDGPRRLIVFNDAHARTRQASDVAHELAHALLLHVPSVALDCRGCRVWPAEYEEEADWLGGALLVPENAALMIARQELSVADAALAYEVSPQMMQYRLNVTGAVRRAELMRTSRRRIGRHR